jgi:hypothetical protein
MQIRWIILVAACLATSGCDRIGGILGSSGSVGGAWRKEVAPGGAADPALEALVSRGDGSVRFRRDLPFPSHVESWVMVRQEHDRVRVSETTLSGPSSRVLDSTVETRIECRKRPGTFEMTLLKAGPAEMSGRPGGKAADPDPGGSSDLEGEEIGFLLTERGWRPRPETDGVDFKRAVWSSELKEHVAQLMIESGVHPRVCWFSRDREWTPGDALDLQAKSLKILEPADVSGKVHLRFEGEEAIDGHPCGVFSVTGRMDVEGMMLPDGVLREGSITIESGKIWASLLHPVILREEYQTIQTLTEKGARVNRSLSGSIKLTKVRSWRPED